MSEPTPGALRAAMRIQGFVDTIIHQHFSQDSELKTFAKWIDEETAAPDLLEVVECLVGYAEAQWRNDTGGRMDTGTSVPTEHVKLARRALAKARG